MAPIFLPDIRPTILGNCPNLPPESSSTGLSPSMVPRSRGLRLLSGGSTDIPKHHIHSPLRESVRFALFPFPSPVLRESLLLSFPAGTKMFQFPAFPLPRQSLGSNSEIPGSTAACASPGLIAACHVLLRISSQAIHWVAWQQIFSLLTPYFLIKREAFDRFLSLQIET